MPGSTWSIAGGSGAVGAPAGSSIVVGGGGAVAVATATLFSQAQSLDDLSVDLTGCRRLLERDDGVLGAHLVTTPAAGSAGRAEAAIDDALRLIDEARRSSEWLAHALRTSADVYGSAEDAMTRLSQSLAAEVGRALGFAGTAVGIAMLPYVLGGAAILGSGYALARWIDPRGTRRTVEGLGRLLDDQRGILSDPAFVTLTRLAVMSSDDVVGGALLVPAPVLRAVGDEGMGIVGTDTAAGLIAGVGSVAFGAFKESGVRVTPGTPVAVTRPVGLADRVDRIPQGRARVRVDRYTMPSGGDRFEVYIAGTSDADAASTDPFDMTSNIAALSGAESGSYRAVELALADAGVTRDSELVITGYSQGGLVGSMLAASGDYEVKGLYTLGAPAAQVPVPDGVPWLAVEHTDDIVPAVGGTWASADPLLVRREALVGHPPDQERTFPSHGIDLYRETAALADATDEERLTRWREHADAFSGGAVAVSSTSYRVERVR